MSGKSNTIKRKTICAAVGEGFTPRPNPCSMRLKHVKKNAASAEAAYVRLFHAYEENDL